MTHLRYGSDEHVVVEEQVRRSCEIWRDVPFQLVVAQVHHGDPHLRRHVHRPPELVMVQQQEGKRELEHRAGNASRESVVAQI